MRADHFLARGPAEQERIEGAKQARWGHRRRRRALHQLDQAVLAFDQLRGDRLQPCPGVAQRQAGPAGEVAVVGGCVPGQIAASQLFTARSPTSGLTPSCRRRRALEVILAAGADRQPRPARVLPLRRQQPLGHRLGRAQGLPGKSLGSQSFGDRRAHGRMVPRRHLTCQRTAGST